MEEISVAFLNDGAAKLFDGIRKIQVNPLACRPDPLAGITDFLGTS